MTGLYVAVKWPGIAYDRVKELCSEYNIPNFVSEIHTTMIYSTGCGTYEPNNKILAAFLENFHIFKTKDGKNALVIKLYSRDLKSLHKTIMDSDSNLTYDFDEYIPHVTVSYDVPDDFVVPNVMFNELIVGRAYAEPLRV